MTAHSQHARLAEVARKEATAEKRAERRRRRARKRRGAAGMGEQLRRLAGNASPAADQRGPQP